MVLVATYHHVVKLVGVVLSLSTQEPPGQSCQKRQSDDSADNTSDNGSSVCCRQTAIASTRKSMVLLGFLIGKQKELLQG
jgi:hypothetical protein